MIGTCLHCRNEVELDERELIPACVEGYIHKFRAEDNFCTACKEEIAGRLDGMMVKQLEGKQ